VSALGLPTLVLVHGAGDTAHVWRRVQTHLTAPSVAVDLLGRASRPYDLTKVTIDLAAEHAAADVRAATDGPVVLVAHSAGGVVTPRLAALLADQVRHIVLVAGITAPEGELPVDHVHPERRPMFEERRPGLFAEHAGRSYARGAAIAALPDHLDPLDNPEVVRAIDSLNLMFQPISWAGVPHTAPRTFVRPLRDQLQSREMQERLARVAGADEIIDIAADHTPARSAPEAFAALLDVLAARHRRPAG
jgi:pimeloyl-ACP methyl ester carboxylesterase